MWWQILLGLVLLVVVVGVAALWAGRRRMGARIDREVEAMIEALSPPATTPLSLDDFPGLPAPVRRYLAAAGVEGRPPAGCARIRHGGTFSTDGGGRWVPIQGEEYFTARPPAFLWAASIRAAPGLSILARDTYAGGSGNMLVTIAGLFPIQDVRGPEIDAASLLRWLSELPVLPGALLPDEHLTWEAVDDTSARARVRHGDLEVSGVYTFGADGLPTGFSARRYRTEGERQVERKWEGWYRDYREVEGFLVPGAFGVAWIVDSREEPYARFEIDAIDFEERERW